MKQTRDAKLIHYLNYGIIAIFLLLPFQGILTTWAGSNFGSIDVFRTWKELLLIPVVFGVFLLVLKDRKLLRILKSNRVVWLIGAYVALHSVLGLIALKSNRINEESLTYGLLINLRFLVFFLVCAIVASKSKWLVGNWRRFILVPALVAVVFGLMQQFVLPTDFLRHFGYGPETIPAVHTVDQNSQFVRIQSTLRGPNPFGAYLLLITSVTISYLIVLKKRQSKLAVFLLASITALFFTYSRSAWLGTIVSISLLVYLLTRNKRLRQYGLVAIAGFVLLVGVAAVIWRNNSALDNTLFHTSSFSRSEDDSNEVRVEAWGKGFKSIGNSPLGQGPGSAGPASFRNDKAPRIADNYFIQLGQEVGVLGLAMFVAICAFIVKFLWKSRGQTLPTLLLASFIGLTIVNLLSHAWADDTLSYIWWGLAGIVLAPDIIKQNAKTNKT